MYLKYLSSLEFFTYTAFLAIVVGAVSYVLPGRKPPLRTEPYSEAELGAHDRKLAKYFVAGGFFLVLGSLHMVVKNVPWIAESLARMGYAGHLVRDLSSTHVMIVGGGTLLATGLCWRVLPRIVGRPLTSEALTRREHRDVAHPAAGGETVFVVEDEDFMREVTTRILSRNGGLPCPEGFRYSSDTNTHWLTVAELQNLVNHAV